jgi:hypothetical protein
MYRCVTCNVVVVHGAKQCRPCYYERIFARKAVRATNGHHEAKRRERDVRKREQRRALATAWEARNPEKVKAKYIRYRARNSVAIYARNDKRTAAQQRATPVWSNDFIVEEAYALRELRQRMTGFSWHVDHIVPLQSPLVCGLHAHTNLQVIPGALNVRKLNRQWPDMP